MRRQFLIGLVAIAAVVTLSCAHHALSTSSNRSPDAPILAPSDPAEIVFLRDAPRDPYVQLGEVFVELEGNWTGREIPSDPEVVEALRAEAAKLGADALLDVVVEREGSFRQGRTYRRYTTARGVVATAIRLRS